MFSRLITVPVKIPGTFKPLAKAGSGRKKIDRFPSRSMLGEKVPGEETRRLSLGVHAAGVALTVALPDRAWRHVSKRRGVVSLKGTAAALHGVRDLSHCLL
jgi:hypothetical protein